MTMTKTTKIRGLHADRVILDEASFISASGWDWITEGMRLQTCTSAVRGRWDATYTAVCPHGEMVAWDAVTVIPLCLHE